MNAVTTTPPVGGAPAAPRHRRPPLRTAGLVALVTLRELFRRR